MQNDAAPLKRVSNGTKKRWIAILWDFQALKVNDLIRIAALLVCTWLVAWSVGLATTCSPPSLTCHPLILILLSLRSSELINWLLKGTVCMAFCLLCFSQLVTIKTTTQSFCHFAGHYKFDWLLKQVMVLVFKNRFQRVKAICETALGREYGPKWDWLVKKIKGRKSRATVPLINVSY
jgi:hypothetical protein